MCALGSWFLPGLWRHRKPEQGWGRWWTVSPEVCGVNFFFRSPECSERKQQYVQTVPSITYSSSVTHWQGAGRTLLAGRVTKTLSLELNLQFLLFLTVQNLHRIHPQPHDNLSYCNGLEITPMFHRDRKTYVYENQLPEKIRNINI